MHAAEVWHAIIRGEVPKLRRLLTVKSPGPYFGQRLDNHHWNILHHAVASRSLECVRLVMEHFRPSTASQCYEGLTPLARACALAVPGEIVGYLLQLDHTVVNTGNNEKITPLHYAVSKNRLDLVELLIASGADVNLADYSDETALHTAAFDIGNVALLINLLFIAKARWPFVKCDEGFTGLELFGARASYDVRDKIACFKILYNYEHPCHMYRQRYDVNAILRMALLSHRSTSLIPYFIETELKCERRDNVRSLYERLLPTYELLAMVVLSECGSVSTERNHMDRIWAQDLSTVILPEELLLLIKCAILDDPSNGSLQLLEDFGALVGRSLTAMRQTIRSIMPPVLVRMYWTLNVELNPRQYEQYVKVVDSLVACTFEIDVVIQRLLTEGIDMMNRCIICPYLKYSTYVFMTPEPDEELIVKPLYQRLLHRFGTWQAIKSTVGTPKFELFSLKRFARDVVRKTVLQTMDASEPSKGAGLQRRFHSLDVPNELIHYLTYSDNNSMSFFF
uniref:ANK_REP_REGION domain-containing protein n=1 Tax=Anopheles dirus TaxID=7168 RepID=A0A182NX41_9DIPT